MLIKVREPKSYLLNSMNGVLQSPSTFHDIQFLVRTFSMNGTDCLVGDNSTQMGQQCSGVLFDFGTAVCVHFALRWEGFGAKATIASRPRGRGGEKLSIRGRFALHKSLRRRPRWPSSASVGLAGPNGMSQLHFPGQCCCKWPWHTPKDKQRSQQHVIVHRKADPLFSAWMAVKWVVVGPIEGLLAWPSRPLWQLDIIIVAVHWTTLPLPA